MIDTHTHIYDKAFHNSGADAAGCCEAVDRAVAAGVDMMIMPNVDLDSMAPIKELHKMRPDVTAMAMGLHTTELSEDWRSTLAPIEAELRSGGYCAVGEVGIDLYWDNTREREQAMAFDAQLGLARELGLPVIIHCREGLDLTLEVLQGHKDTRAVFHSFGGTTADVERILQAGDFYFGINGIVTFKNSTLRSVLPAIPTDRILTETDSPYLAPVPYRGKRNESSYIPLIVATIADSLGKSPAEVGLITTANAKTLFAL